MFALLFRAPSSVIAIVIEKARVSITMAITITKDGKVMGHGTSPAPTGRHQVLAMPTDRLASSCPVFVPRLHPAIDLGQRGQAFSSDSSISSR